MWTRSSSPARVSTAKRASLTSNELNAQAKQAMLRAGRQKILVVDSSKIDKVSFVNITPVSGIEAVVTNARPSEVWLRYLEDQGVRCIYPKD